MEKNAIDALLLETRRRQRRKTDLSEFDTTLKEMMDLDISLPVILTWLEKQEKQTTLPALRRYIRRVFGEEFYDRFLLRNGWQRTKQEEKKKSTATNPINEKKETKTAIEAPAVKPHIKAKIATVEKVKEVTRGRFDPNQFNEDAE